MLDKLGFHRPTYEEIVEQTEQIAKEVFGEDIETSEQTPFGKFIRIVCYVHADIYKDLEYAYYARFPNTASGINLDRLCPFAGITRNPATYAEHKIKVFGQQDAEISEIRVCGEDNDIVFHNIMPFTLSTATEGNEPEYYAIVEVQCETAGKVGNVSSIDNIVEHQAEVIRVEYEGLTEPAVDLEDDYTLRKRFAAAIAGAGSCNENAIRAALLRVPTVLSSGVIVNDTDFEDSEGRPPHSFECFVYGGKGREKDIAEVIFEKKPVGIKTCTTTGNEPVEVLDSGGGKHEIYFSFTQDVPIYIKIQYVKNASFEEGGEEQIQKIVADYINGLGVGVDVVLSTLYGYIYQVTGVTDVTSIELSTDGKTYTTDNIIIGDWQVAQTQTSWITL